MNDLIKRKSVVAVDALSGIATYKVSIPSSSALTAQPEVIRCRDCEFYTAEDKWCRRLGLCGAFGEDDYCSHAERKEVEDG